jgi:hypothetical protein
VVFANANSDFDLHSDATSAKTDRAHTMRYLTLLFAILSIGGCATENSTVNQTVLTDPKTHLTRGRDVYIATPKNGWYENVEYPGSGRIAASNLRAAFARFSDRVVISEHCQDLDCLKHETKGTSNAYYVVPEILHWESHGHNLTMKPDEIEIKVSVFDHDHDKSLASAILSAKSKNTLLTFDSPQDTLQNPINRYISSLY